MDIATIYNDEYSESFRKYRVYTSMNILLRLRPVLKALGMSDLLSTGKLEGNKIGTGLLAALEDKGLLNEFCQVISNTNTDFMQEEPGVIMWMLHDFFVGLYWQMPRSWRDQIKASIGSLVKLGQISLAEKIGGTIQKTGSITND